ncbi:hypothetical protein EDC04DRAFT_3137610 [Pisolithus marmoratus]|nr:hypothetical protein EDC04DRAFT_3137610 [Pisolithus marmoratus]
MNNRRVTRTVDWTGQNFQIPKRGEEDFEPTRGGGSGLQLHILDWAGSAVFEVLRAERSISSKSVYAYLKRLGFVVKRARPLSDILVAPSHSSRQPAARPANVWKRIATSFSNVVSKVLSVIGLIFHRSPWRPLGFRGIESNSDIFKSLRFLPCGHSTPLFNCSSLSEGTTALPPTFSAPPCWSPYSIFFHVYRPSTLFRKTAPPLPDFYVVIIGSDIRFSIGMNTTDQMSCTTAAPSLYELTALFEGLPEMPLPPLRKRGAQTAAKEANNTAMSKTPRRPPKSSIPLPTDVDPTPTLLSSIQAPYITSLAPSPDVSRNPIPPKPNLFEHLAISFFRFGEGAFHDWPMLGSI